MFLGAILNSQPMGFYAPAQLVRDAVGHGVEVRPVDVNRSDWDCTLEPAGDGRHAVRLGLRMVRGLPNLDGARVVLGRAGEGYASVEDVWRRAQVPAAALRRLASADAYRGSLGLSRRDALWAIRALRDEPLPLFAAADARAGAPRPELDEQPVQLAPMTAGREVVEDYRSQGLTLRRHPLTFLRADLASRGLMPCAELARAPNHGRVEVAGLVLIRQKPGSAKGVMFITIEDETAQANLVVWPALFERRRRLVLQAGMMGVRGRVQRQGGVTHVVADDLVDLTDLLRRVGDVDEAFPLGTGRGDEARHGGSPDLRGRAEPRGTGALGLEPRDIYVPDLRVDGTRPAEGGGAEPAIRVRTRDFR